MSSTTPLQAFNYGFGFYVNPKSDLANISKKEQKHLKEDIKTMNLLKFCSYVPILGTIIYAIAISKMKNLALPKKVQSSLLARAVISIIPGLGLALLPVDLFATAVTHPIQKSLKRSCNKVL